MTPIIVSACGLFEGRRPTPFSSSVRRKGNSGIRTALRAFCLLAFGLIFHSSPSRADDKPVLKLTTSVTTARLLGAHCPLNCRLSGLFAPSVMRDNVTALPLTNSSTKTKIGVTGEFIATNGLAMAQDKPFLILDDQNRRPILGASPPAISLDSGDTVQLKLALAPSATGLPAGLYTGQLQFKAAAAGAETVMHTVPVEIRIRDSALWPLLTILFGILLGRVAQLVYDPNVQAKVRLLDWLNELEAKVTKVPAGNDRTVLEQRLADLKTRLSSRGVDPAAIQTEILALQGDIDKKINPQVAAPTISMSQPNKVGQGLRILAGVTPLSLPGVHRWLLPIFVLFTLAALTVVFMVQNYGGSETFGAGGLADYATLFLAGVASEALVGGLRAVKFH